MPDKAAERNFFTETGSKFEPLLIKMLCQPLLPYIPARVHPNTITLATHAIVWTTALLGVSSPHLAPFGRALALIGAGAGMFLSMIGDCIDGMHARRTNQCSKLGEMMDHWLDALAVPLATMGITCALEVPPWAMVLVNISAAMIYHAQLVLYHHTGKFIHPEPASGPEAQFGVALGYVTLAGLFYSLKRTHPWLHMAIDGLAIAATIVQLRCAMFFYPKLGRRVSEHLWFVGLCGAFGALFLIGEIDLHYFLCCVVFMSFRICGTYVLHTLVKERYNGKDLGLLCFVLAIGLAHYSAGSTQLDFHGVRLTNWLAATVCVYAAARNFMDFVRYYAGLRPRPA